GARPLRGRHRAVGCRSGEAGEEAGSEECRGAGLVGNGGDGGGGDAGAYRVRPGHVESNPPQLSRDGEVALWPRSTLITRRLTARTRKAQGPVPSRNHIGLLFSELGLAPPGDLRWAPGPAVEAIRPVAPPFTLPVRREEAVECTSDLNSHSASDEVR